MPPMALEHTKEGKDRALVDLPCDKPHHFVGKNPICALRMDHPTVSRIHAVRLPRKPCSADQQCHSEGPAVCCAIPFSPELDPKPPVN